MGRKYKCDEKMKRTLACGAHCVLGAIKCAKRLFLHCLSQCVPECEWIDLTRIFRCMAGHNF